MFTFPSMWDKRCLMATLLFDDFFPVVSAGDFTGEWSTNCWSISESLLDLVFFSLGVYIFYCFLSIFFICFDYMHHALHFMGTIIVLFMWGWDDTF